MACPACGEESKVTGYRSANGFVRRRRACVSCGYLWRTVEVPVGLLGALPDVGRGLRQVHGTLGHVIEQLDKIPLTGEDEETWP